MNDTYQFQQYPVTRGRRPSEAVQVTVGTQALHITARAFDALGRPERVTLAADVDNGVFAISAADAQEPNSIKVALSRVAVGTSVHPSYSVAGKAFKAWAGIGSTLDGRRFAARMVGGRLLFGPGLDAPKVEES